MCGIKNKDMKKSITIVSATLLSGALFFVSCKQKAAQTNSYNMVDSSAYYNNPANASGVSKQPVAAYPTTTRTHQRSYATRSSYQAQSTTTRKKGWSSAAKGTAIGAGSGAVLGAVVAGDHNRVKGAVVGGVVGAAGGYIYGRHRDKKHKRY